MPRKAVLIPEAQVLTGRITTVRGVRVVLDVDLAAWYAVATKALNQTVKRNQARFPADFCFTLTTAEAAALRSRSQSVTLNVRGANLKHLPTAFTEHGIAMLAGLLRSPRAIQVNIAIMRAFVAMRQAMAQHAELGRKLAAIEEKIGTHDRALIALFKKLESLDAAPAAPTSLYGGPTKIGFRVKERPARYAAAARPRPR